MDFYLLVQIVLRSSIHCGLSLQNLIHLQWLAIFLHQISLVNNTIPRMQFHASHYLISIHGILQLSHHYYQIHHKLDHGCKYSLMGIEFDFSYISYYIHRRGNKSYVDVFVLMLPLHQYHLNLVPKLYLPIVITMDLSSHNTSHWSIILYLLVLLQHEHVQLRLSKLPTYHSCNTYRGRHRSCGCDLDCYMVLMQIHPISNNQY